MALIQALLSLLSRSAGKVLNAIFGWAVRALFGDTTPTEQTILSGLVGAAVLWPLLLIGLIAPKVAALVLAAVPLPHWVSGNIVRLVWLTLALIVPLVIGLVVALRSPGPRKGSLFVNVMRGFPITVGLAAAFLIMFVSVPVLKVVNIARGCKDVSVPMITNTRVYHDVAALVVRTLNAHGFNLKPSMPKFWVVAPVKILLKLGGDAFRNYVPERLEHFTEDKLEIALYPSGALLRGQPRQTTWAHSLICEAIIETEALQTTSVEAQSLERQIRRIWQLVKETPRHINATPLQGRLGDIASNLAALDATFEDWQIVYRQALQLSRALTGKPQLLEHRTPPDSTLLKTSLPATPANLDPDEHATRDSIRAESRRLERLPFVALVGEAVNEASHLVHIQVTLAKAELKDDLKKELALAKGLSMAVLMGFYCVSMLGAAAALAFAKVMPAWTAGLVVCGALIVIAGIAGFLGYRARVQHPLEKTRAGVRADLNLVKEHAIG